MSLFSDELKDGKRLRGPLDPQEMGEMGCYIGGGPAKTTDSKYGGDTSSHPHQQVDSHHIVSGSRRNSPTKGLK